MRRAQVGSGLRSLIAAALLAGGALAPPAHAAPVESALCPAGVAAPARIPLARLRAIYGAQGDRYITIDGVELRYRDEGRGPVLLLFHGSSSTLNQWDGVTARLKDR